jgi:hypothetical protein
LSNYALTAPDIQEIIKAKNEPSMISMLKKYNEWVELKIQISNDRKTYHSTAKLLNSLVLMGKAIAILTYDLLSASTYNSNINKLEEFKFLRYIRNGAAHYNKFNLKDEEGTWKLGETETIKWGNKEINRQLHGNQVFNDFVSVFDMFLLADHFSKKLGEIDHNRK